MIHLVSPLRALPLVVILLAAAASCASTDRNGAFRDMATPTTDTCCPDFKVGYDMTVTDYGVDPSVRGAFAAFAQSMGDSVVLSTKMLDDVTAACRSIATDLGGLETDTAVQGRTGQEASYSWCNFAVQKLHLALSDTLQPAGRLSFVFSPPTCTVDAPYLHRCETACSKDASCEDKPLASRCEAAHTVGICTGKCGGECLGSAAAPAACEGKCEGACQGQCLGSCTGTCDNQTQNGGGRCRGTCIGVCEGYCKGRCGGACKLAKTGSGRCDALCEGSCSTPLVGPKCAGNLKDASCPVDPDCSIACKASGQARASCSAPSVFVGARDDFGNAMDVWTEIRSLERNLGVLFSAAKGRGLEAEEQIKSAYEAGQRITRDNPKLGLKGQACAQVMRAAGEQSLETAHAAVAASNSVLLTLPLDR